MPRGCVVGGITHSTPKRLMRSYSLSSSCIGRTTVASECRRGGHGLGRDSAGGSDGQGSAGSLSHSKRYLGVGPRGQGYPA